MIGQQISKAILVTTVIAVISLSGLLIIEEDEKVLFLVQAGSQAASFMLLTLATKINQAAAQYGFIVVVGVRIVVTILMLHWIATDVQGFELIDPKQMQDSIRSIAFAAIFGIVKWKFDLLVGIPITAISVYFVQRQVFSVENDNMSCYVVPDAIAVRQSNRETYFLILGVAMSYFFRYINLKRFIEQD